MKASHQSVGVTGIPAGNNAARLWVRLFLGFILLLSFAWAYSNRFVLDDAFISFRYARNLAEGHGLLFNPGGERVEGYTNFLWTLVMSLAFRRHVDPILFSWTLSLAMFPLSLLLTYGIGTRLSGSQAVGLAGAFLTGTHYTYSAFATGGMETQAQSFLFLALTMLFLRIRERPSPRRLWLFSLTAATAFLTRMDSACIIGPAYVFLTIHLWRTDARKAPARLAQLALPALGIAVIWLAWKLTYYGPIFPNTFAAKTRAPGVIPGLYYLGLYFFSYGLAVFIPALLTAAWKRGLRPTWTAEIVFPATTLFCWCAYVVAVGGDFMEFRLMVPVIPLLFIGSAWGLNRCFQTVSARIAWTVFLVGVSQVHAQRTRLYGVETVRGLEYHVRDASWIQAGRTLQDQLGSSDLVLATTAAGAIPYYSRLNTVDMLGLNDAWVARNGIPTQNLSRGRLGEKPGHRIKAPMEYLVRRGTHLVIGHPRFVRPGETRFQTEDFLGPAFYQFDTAPPVGSRILEIPVAENKALLAVALRHHPALEQAIAREGWRAYPLEPRDP